MASEIPADSFLDLLRQSGLVSDSRLLAIRGEFAGDAAKAEGARALADELVKRGILTQWQADNLLQGKHRGFRLGPHRILGPLGRGGMSKVFLAEHEMMHRLSAIKVLPAKYQEDPDLLGRFHREAEAIAKLDHPHIVRAYDFDKDVHYGKELYYLVMEYIDGQDLRRMVDQQGPLDYRKAADFIAQAADGLAHAHAAGFVHRDIKPANLIVDNNGVLKILDLGLARFTFEGENPWETSEGEPSAVGTADYVAPEQVADSRNADGRADIYSLGLTFYFLLTGRRPFPKATLVDVLLAHRTEQPEPINELRPDVPFDLIEIIDRMIAKAPIQRYQTAREVADALRSWLSESPSGREYSRISALMAAAMRAKQPSSPENGPAPPAAETAELELAALDDEPRGATGAKSAEGERAQPAHSAAAAGQQKPRKAPAGESGKLPSGKRPASGDSKRALPRLPADMFSELLPNELGSAGSAGNPLAMLPAEEAQRPLPAHRPLKRPQAERAVLKSPWLWTGLALLVVVVLVVWLILPGGSRKERPGGGPTANGTGQETHPLPPTPPQAPSPPAGITPPSHPAEGPESLSEQPTDAEQLLAGITKISLNIKTPDRDRNSRLSSTVTNQAVAAAKQLGLTLGGSDLPMLEINVKFSDDPDLYIVVLSAELKVRAPEDKTMTVWRQNQRVVALPRKGLPPEQTEEALKAGVADFFDQFVDDVRQARTKVKPK